MTLTRVGHLETVIRVPDVASPLPARLDEIARERLPAALAVSVDRALPEIGEVVVLRHVDLDLTIEATASTGIEQIADHWAKAAGAAVATVTVHGDDRDVARFPDEATFVAYFIRDLLGGHAWEKWCYGAFAELRGLPVGSAIAHVLGSHADILGATLRTLRYQGTLEQALSTLRLEDATTVWQSALARAPEALDSVSALPIAAGALRIARRLGLLVDPAPEPVDLAASHRRWAPQPLDWSSRAALADAVAHALAELVRSGFLREPAPGLRERAASAATDFDWLDQERLVSAVVSMLDPAESGPVLLDDDSVAETLRRSIEVAARETGLELGGRRTDDPLIAMRLLAALAERNPELADDPAAALEIQRLLEQAAVPGGIEPVDDPARIGATDVAAAEIGGEWRRCEAAGMLLLSRALVDTRLAALASRLGLPAPGLAGDPSAALLLALGLAVAGPDGVAEDGRLDPALLALVGRDDDVTATELADAWSETDAAQHRALRDKLAELGIGQRLDRPRPVPDCWHPSLPGLARGTAARAAHLAIMAWARWLQGLSGSSTPFLLAQLLRRGGSVSIEADAVRVVVDPRPLDVVIELAGCFEPLERVLWLGGRTLHISRGVT